MNNFLAHSQVGLGSKIEGRGGMRSPPSHIPVRTEPHTEIPEDRSIMVLLDVVPDQEAG